MHIGGREGEGTWRRKVHFPGEIWCTHFALPAVYKCTYFTDFPDFPSAQGAGSEGERTWRTKIHLPTLPRIREIWSTHFALAAVYKCTYFPDFPDFPSAQGEVEAT